MAVPSCGYFNEVPRLLKLIQTSGYEIVQDNGQRKYGPPPDWKGPPPPKGSEVFVGKLPRDCFEDEIVPFMERIGKIYELRLMLDFSGSNRGYAFVTYTNQDDAARAIRKLNNIEIRKGRPLGVVKSGDNCRLFVGGLPKNKNKEDIKGAVAELVDGVKDVILYSCVADKSKNRGFAFVEFVSHRAAAMARRKLLGDKAKLWGKNFAVDWAEPEVDVDDDVMAKVTVLYVRNLMLMSTEQRIKNIFEQEGKAEVEKVKKIRDFAFVHFKSREAAERALDIMNGYSLDGSKVEVTWAKPVNRHYYRLKKEMNEQRGGFDGDLKPVISRTNYTHQQEFLSPWRRTKPHCTDNPMTYGGHVGETTGCQYPGGHVQLAHLMNRVPFTMPVNQEISLSSGPIISPCTEDACQACGYQINWPVDGDGYDHNKCMSGPVLSQHFLMVPPYHASNGLPPEFAVTYVVPPPAALYVAASRKIADDS